VFDLANPGVSFLLVAIGSAALCWVLRPVARSLGWVDQPEARKIHDRAVPLVGGLAIFSSVTAGVFLFDLPLLKLAPLLAAAAIVFVVGLIDDRHHLSARTRFGFQLGACLVMIFIGNLLLVDFGRLLWDAQLRLGWVSVPVTVFCVVGVINALNMIDGLDGLSASIFIVAAGSMYFLALGAGRIEEQSMLLLFAAATLGFVLLNARLPWNRRARVFLGDSGSTLLGFALGWYFIDLSQGPERAFAPVTALWLFAVPLLDTVFLLIRRLLEGKSPFEADQEHLHHAFLQSGFSVTATWLSMLLIAVALAGLGLLGEFFNWPQYARFYGFLALAAGYYLTMNKTWKTRRFLGRTMKLL
jgi:UDP-GlcNAc:undecaprenyl-phosphate GlcNAc-1-phosphate transferase